MEDTVITWHAPPLQLGAGVKNFRKVFAGGESQKFLFWWGKGLLKRFAPFSYLNHSFILCLNVKVCIRFLPISLFFFYLSRVILDERFVH